MDTHTVFMQNELSLVLGYDTYYLNMKLYMARSI